MQHEGVVRLADVVVDGGRAEYLPVVSAAGLQNHELLRQRHVVPLRMWRHLAVVVRPLGADRPLGPLDAGRRVAVEGWGVKDGGGAGRHAPLRVA